MSKVVEARVKLLAGLAIALVVATAWLLWGGHGADRGKDSVSEDPREGAAEVESVALSSPGVGIDNEPRIAVGGVEALSSQATIDRRGPLNVSASEKGVLVSGVALSSIRLDDWSAEELESLRLALAQLQSEELLKFKGHFPTENLFITDAEYVSNKLWNSSDFLVGDHRKVSTPEGGEEDAFGYLRIPTGVAPKAERIEEAIRRVISEPQLVAERQEKGYAYVDQVMAEHPNAVFDVSPDFTVWCAQDPDGTTVGWYSVSTSGSAVSMTIK